MTRRKLRRRFGRAARAKVWPYYAVRGVLGGRYRAGREETYVTHAVGQTNSGREGPWDEDEKTLCRRVRTENLVDVMGASPEDSKPTCPACAERLAKIRASKVA